MKRLTILAIIIGLAALCLGQYRAGPQTRRTPRVSSRTVIQLTDPNLKGSISLEEALNTRRSVRQFSGQALRRVQISQLAWAGQGITEPQAGLRTAPSAGALYPIELYFATEEGLYTYLPGQHSLEQVLEQDIRNELAATTATREVVAGAPCDIIIAGSVKKLITQFRDKARNFMLLEAGHIAQNILLQAVSLDLGSVTIGDFDTKSAGKICKLSRDLEPLYIICVGCPAAEATLDTGTRGAAAVKRAALIVAVQNFRDEELFETKRVLDEAGIATVIASSRIGIIRGMLGNTAEAGVLVNRLRVDDYDAIIFIGGPGSAEYFNNPAALDIAREAAAKRKVVGAICVAPSILANAGVLMGVRATSIISERDNLVRAGAVYTGNAVERDRFIITASGPPASVRFGQAIVDALAGR